jgi:hypothetical protein
MSILDGLIDRMGNMNPQIFREFKQRLTPRNISIAAVLSFLGQGLIWFSYYSQIPVADPRIREMASQYCYSSTPNDSYNKLCKIDMAGNFLIDWKYWWSEIFNNLSFLLPLALLLGSMYLLTADLVEEEKRGTLNFIRLSPQSVSSIFIGKILGVPIVIYLAVMLAIPFHFIAGINGGGNIGLLLAWYLTIASMWFLLSSIALLYVLLGGSQTIAIVALLAFPISTSLSGINAFASATLRRESWLLEKNIQDIPHWYALPILSNAIWFYAFIICCFLALTYWIWQALSRRYVNPTATILSKFQSYQINISLGIWLLGFIVSTPAKDLKSTILGVGACHIIALFLLIPILLPTKQALQDWSRYRYDRSKQNVGKSELVRDLIINDKSPTLLAIAINLGMAIALWMLVSFVSNGYNFRLITGLYSAASLILIYAAIAHLTSFLKVRKRNIWTTGILGGVMFLPIATGLILAISSGTRALSTIIFLFSSAAPFMLFSEPTNTFQPTDVIFLGVFIVQFILLILLTLQLQRRLKVINRSSIQDPRPAMPE